LDLTTRVNLVKSLKDSERPDPKLPTIKDAAALLDINRTSVYYKGRQASETELEIMNHIDQMHTNHPTWGKRQLASQLKAMGYEIGKYKVRRFMDLMGIEVIYPKPNLSKPMKGHKVYPYLLRNKKATAPNQVWSIDITYIRLKHGFVYLTAIIDWYSRYIVGWHLDDTLDTTAALVAVERSFEIAKPDILNSDQGCQFTSHLYTDYLKEHSVQISMDGKGRWADNIMIERWFRSLKYDEVYLNEYKNLRDARAKIADYITSYNWTRHHSAVGYRSPASVYHNIEGEAA